jgi:hypothetical protein
MTPRVDEMIGALLYYLEHKRELDSSFKSPEAFSGRLEFSQAANSLKVMCWGVTSSGDFRDSPAATEK